jgi:putative DNA primase/helicase
MISPVVRAMLSCVPLHASSAPAPGTGKTFLWEIPAAISIGDAMPIMAAGRDLEEFEKRLGSQVIEGIRQWSIDNVTMSLGGEALCQLIERLMYKPRILGKSEMKERRNNWCVFASGNNLRIRDDVTRRVLLARMDAKLERPELRKFQGNPFERVLANRGLYIWAALTVVLAYREAGVPGKLAPIGDPFLEWSDNVRSALVWLGRADPVATMDAVRENDPSRQARKAILQAIHTAYGKEGRTAAEMIEDAKAGGIKPRGKGELDRKFSSAATNLKAAIVQYTSDRLEAKYLGSKFGVDRDKITDGLCLRREYDSHLKINTWSVEHLQ